MDFAEQEEVCVGGTKPRMFFKLQLELSILIAMPTLGILCAFWWWWILIPVTPAWLICWYQTKRDPYFLSTWLDHLTLPEQLES